MSARGSVLASAQGVLASVALAGGRWVMVPMAKRMFEGPIAPLRSLERVNVRDALDTLRTSNIVEVRPGAQGQGCTAARLVTDVGPLELEPRRPHSRVVFRDDRKRPTWPVLDAPERAEVWRIHGELCRVFDAMQQHRITLTRGDAEALAIELRRTLAEAGYDRDFQTSPLSGEREAPGRPSGRSPGVPLPGPVASRFIDAAKFSLGPVSYMLATAGDEIDLRPWIQPIAIFNGGSLRLGGRAYHALQNWPPAYRTRIRIDGAPVVEIDYQSLHPRLLCDATGTDAGGDFYAGLVGDLPRTAVKIATNTAWCCDSMGDAIAVITHAMREQGACWPRLAALAFVDRFAAAYPALVPFVACGAGRTLQNIDGQIARRVMLEMGDVGCVGIHDSFIVPEHAADRLRATMGHALADGMAAGRDRLRACAGSTAAPELRAWLAAQIEDAESERLAAEDRSGALL